MAQVFAQNPPGGNDNRPDKPLRKTQLCPLAPSDLII